MSLSVVAIILRRTMNMQQDQPWWYLDVASNTIFVFRSSGVLSYQMKHMYASYILIVSLFFIIFKFQGES
jgi:hypothetical protein